MRRLCARGGSNRPRAHDVRCSRIRIGFRFRKASAACARILEDRCVIADRITLLRYLIYSRGRARFMRRFARRDFHFGGKKKNRNENCIRIISDERSLRVFSSPMILYLGHIQNITDIFISRVNPQFLRSFMMH